MVDSSVDDEPLVIETGVDKLVNLVKRYNRISVADAVKQLGVTNAVIEEWADFLEEEGIISLEYKFTNTFLVERRLSKKELDKKSKDFHGKKEAFSRRVESTLNTLERESDGLDAMKEQFNKLRNELDHEIDKVRNELGKLEEYRSLKQGVDKQISALQQDFRSKIQEGNKSLEREKQKFQELIQEISEEDEKLESETVRIRDIQELESAMASKLQNFRTMIDKVEKKIEEEGKQLGLSMSHITKLKDMEERIKSEIQTKKTVIDSLVKENKQNEDTVLKFQEKILQKIKQNATSIDKTINVGNVASSKFKKFFERKLKAEKLIEKTETDFDILKQDLVLLLKKSKAFDLNTKSGSVGKKMNELKKAFSDVERRKKEFESNVSELNQIIKGQ